MLPPANIATDGGWGARTRADVLGAVDTLISSLIGIACAHYSALEQSIDGRVLKLVLRFLSTNTHLGSCSGP
jgi:hypothetical protein